MTTTARARRIAHLQRMDAPAAGFWEARAAEYQEAHKGDPKPDPHAHRKLPTSDLMATCRPCGEAKIRWMAAQPPLSHLHGHGIRLATIHGVKL